MPPTCWAGTVTHSPPVFCCVGAGCWPYLATKFGSGEACGWFASIGLHAGCWAGAGGLDAWFIAPIKSAPASIVPPMMAAGTQ
jgi:hypothetical protein